MAKLGFLGTGLIGGGMARAAAERGDEVVAWNRTRARAAALEEYGVRVADTPAEAVEAAERVHLAFPHDEVVEDVLAMFLETIDEETVIVDHTTTSPVKTGARGARLQQGGVHYLHAPVFMSPASCRNASGMMLVAGPQSTFEAVAAGLEEMTGRVKYLGEDMRQAAAYKLFGNAMLIAIIGGIADVFAMAAELDLDPEKALGFFDEFDPTAVLNYRGEKMAQGDYEPSFELSMARKDVRLMLEAAGRHALSVLPGIAERMDELIADGYGDRDVGILSADAIPPRDG